jgi:hypothetical protein
MLDMLKAIFKETCEQLNCELLEFAGEDDHVHLMVSAHPKIAISNLIRKLKGNPHLCLEKHFGSKLNQSYGVIIFGHQATVSYLWVELAWMSFNNTLKINANLLVKNKLINQKKYRLKADGLLDPHLKETGLRKSFVQVRSAIHS